MNVLGSIGSAIGSSFIAPLLIKYYGINAILIVGGCLAILGSRDQAMTVLNEIDHTRAAIRRWMRPTHPKADWLFWPARAEVRYQPLGVVGVGHPVGSVPDVRRTDARSRERDRREGVAQAFHVSLYKVDPRLCVLACNLLAKDDWRAALADEMVEGGP